MNKTDKALFILFIHFNKQGDEVCKYAIDDTHSPESF